MKKLLTITATCLIVGVGVASAQQHFEKAPEIDPRTGLPLENPIKSGLEKATEKLVANITAALAAFKEVNRPPQEKLAIFDKLIAEVRSANNLVAHDGELFVEIKKTVEMQLEKQKKWQAKSRDPETRASRRPIYRELALMEEENAKRIGNFQTLLQDLQKELDDKIKATGKDKEFYIDMIEAQQVKKATEVLDQVAVSMSEVISAH